MAWYLVKHRDSFTVAFIVTRCPFHAVPLVVAFLGNRTSVVVFSMISVSQYGQSSVLVLLPV